jgi:conjugative relaxase-like TrwC/TraI family protein
MTLSYKKLGKGATGGEYYVNASQLDDYYLNEGVTDDQSVQREPPGRWYDPAGTMPAIRDGETVDANTFRSLLGGFDPVTGEALVKGAGDQHVSGYDFTFSAPKGVSAIWSQLDADQRAAIEAAQNAAVRQAMQFMSDKAGIARRGAGGAIKENVDLIAALWPHASSRENDPQLHTHTTVFNLARCEDGKYRTIDVNQILKWQTAIAGIYHTALAAQLTDVLGIRCEVREDEFIFDVPDVPEAVKEHWSKRSQAIKQASADLPADALSKAVLDKLTIETRDKKSELTRAELLERWVEEGRELGFSREQAEALFHQAQRAPLTQEDIEAIADAATKRLTYGHSVFNESAAYAMIGVLMQGRGTAADIEAAGEWLIKERLVQMGVSPDGHRVFSTPEMIALEKCMIEDSKFQSDAHIQPADVVEAAIVAKQGITAEQANAVRHACFDTKMVSIVEGSAGAGKSFTMEAVKSVYEQQGYTLHGLALSWTAAGVLSDEAKIEHTRAIEGFVLDLANQKIQLDSKSVILVDEAGLVGSRHMSAILAAAKDANAKVILTGDSLQLAPVEAGGAAEAIIEEIGSARIDEVRRQGSHVRNDPEQYAAFQWQRDAVLEFAHGHAESALRAYEDRGLVHMADDHDAALDAMLGDWNDYRLTEGAGRALLLANDNETVRALNSRVRQVLRQEGIIGEDAVTIRTSDLKSTATISFAVGDKVMFRKNDKNMGIQGDQTKDEQRATSGVFNRTTGTIRAIRQDNDGTPLFTIALDKGGTVEIRAGKGGYWDGQRKGVPLQHAYATTIYASQGMTVQRSFLLDSRHIERRLAYVGMSRHREECRVYVDRQAVHERMMERLGTDEWRPLTEVLDAELMGAVTKSWSRASEKLTTVQYLKEQAGERVKKDMDAQARHDNTISSLNTTAKQMEATMQKLSKANQMSADERRARAEQNYKEFGERIETAKRIDLPAWLMSRGVSLKKEGTKGFVETVPTADKPFHFFQGDDGKWRARSGDTYLDAVGYVQQLERRDFKETVLFITGGDAMTALAASQALQQAQRQPKTKGNDMAAAIVIRSAAKEQQERAAAYARDERGISRETLIDAHKQGFLALDDRGVAFIGYDEHRKIRNAETRLLKPEPYQGDWLSKISYGHSDKTFSPILRGNDRDLHMVEGGFDALALHDLAKREGKETPTVIVTGGAKTLKWSQNPQVQQLIKGAETITNHRENEVDKKTGLPDPKKQAETDAAHEKQVAAIVEIRGTAQGVKNARPPAGVKDLADWNKRQQDQQRQLQLHQEEEHRSGLRM